MPDVVGSNHDYSLVVVRNADFDTEGNNDIATAQDISLVDHAVLGAISNNVFIQPGSGHADRRDLSMLIGNPFRVLGELFLVMQSLC